VAIQELHPSATTGRVAVLVPQRRRLAIVSTSNKLCGIAAYTAALERQLADLFDITVFDLDQYLLRSRHRRVRAIADRHIKEICGQLAEFDAVNLQVEYGTLGRRSEDIFRRFGWLIDAAPCVSVTLHTMKPPPTFPWRDFVAVLLAGKFRSAADVWSEHRRNYQLSLGVAQRLRRAQQQKPVSIIVHNRRDARDARHLHGLDNVFDHPLAFLGSADAATVLDAASRRRFPLLDTLPAETVLIGVFGFLDTYKGFGAAVRALHHLPKHYHLLIFGGVHPNEIPLNRPIHPYLSTLFNEAYVDTTPYERIAAGGSAMPSLSLGSDRFLIDLLGTHPRDLSDRIHFMGALDDADFLAGMAICDAVVFPYLEVGQSASGPISQALELGRRVIASRTHTFLQFAMYHPDRIEFFDIGNHLELAGRILARPQHARRAPLVYNVETNKAVYLAASNLEEGATRSQSRRQAKP
jgi:glycosyltransferase involved in cell wall biosynthesis